MGRRCHRRDTPAAPKTEAASDQLLPDTADAGEESDGGCSGSDSGGGSGSPTPDALEPADSVATAPVLGGAEAPQASGLSASVATEPAEASGEEAVTVTGDADAGEAAAIAAAADLAATTRATAAPGNSGEGALGFAAGTRGGGAAVPAARDTAATAGGGADRLAAQAEAAGGGVGGAPASQQWWPAAVVNTGRMRIPAATTRVLMPQRSRSGAGPPSELTFVVGRNAKVWFQPVECCVLWSSSILRHCTLAIYAAGPHVTLLQTTI